jgi:hypothetical protein
LDFDLAKAVAEIPRLWDRISPLVWLALAIGTGLGSVLVGPTWLLTASLVFAALTVSKWYQEHSVQTVRLVPIETQCFYHRAVQNDGSVTTQISIRMEVFNISDKSIWLPGLKLLRPRSHAPVSIKHVALKHQSGVYHGPYELPPDAKTDGSINLMIQEDLTDQIARRGIKLCIEDQFGHRHKLNLPNLRKS